MCGHSSLRGNFYRRHSGGFTLVEIIISIVLIGMLAAVGASMLKDTFTTASMVNANTTSAGQARYALERLAREIREIKFNTSTGQYCIDTITWAGSSSLVFRKMSAAGLANTNPTDCNTEVTRVSIAGGSSLTYGYSPDASTAFTTSTLINNVIANAGGIPLLKYYQIDGATPATSTGNIRFVEITLTVADSTSGVQSTAQRTRVALRNQ